MINKKIKELGVSSFLSFAINRLLRKIFGIQIIKTHSISLNKVQRKIFSKCKIKYSEEGFWFLDPMPSKSELETYYSSLYWDSRVSKDCGFVVERDIVHFLLLKQYIPNFMSETKSFLNFGAGYGGISNLCWLNGMDIVNVEPSLLPDFYHERWRNLSDITEVPDNSMDIIYGSHSLEHVQNIHSAQREIERVLKPGGYVFWEVPNAHSPNDKSLIDRGIVDIPHTYYFETKFFENWFSELLLCDAFEQSHLFDEIVNWHSFKDSKGPVIRALGRID
jgi:SAM-dependent methyltransferase